MNRSWRGIVEALRDPDIEHVLYAVDKDTSELGQRLRIPVRDIRTQLRLHLPLFSRRELQSTHAKTLGLETLERLEPDLTRTAEALHHSIARAGLSAATQALGLGRASGGLEALATQWNSIQDSGHATPAVVERTVGLYIERNLHYLRAPRADSIRMYGVTRGAAAMPMAYLALSACDRGYVWEALRTALGNVSRDNVLVLSRVYALPGCPKNTLSWLLRHLRRELATDGYTHLITAVNPMLGFSGASFLASAFRPFATSPVNYAYDSDLRYVTRRTGLSHVGRLLDTPNNLLLVKGLNRHSQRRVEAADRLIVIEKKAYEEGDSPSDEASPVLSLRPKLEEFRSRLEESWRPWTAYPGSERDFPWRQGDPTGQCGVSSAWLAKELKTNFSLNTTFCRGSLRFASDSIQDVPDHCWLEVSVNRGEKFILDLTCDQAQGFSRRIVLDPALRLEKSGIFYCPIERTSCDELETNGVWERLQLLLREIDKSETRAIPNKN